jgi:hypothetical protein
MWRNRALAALASPLLLLAAQAEATADAPADPARIAEDQALQLARRTGLNSPWSEAAVLAGGRATRTGETLTLPLADSPALSFTSHSKACEQGPQDCVRYQLVADLKTRHLYVVAALGYEGCPDYHLIDDRSGRDSVVNDLPGFSADGSRALIANECVASEPASGSALEIWQRSADRYSLEWTYHPDSPRENDLLLSGEFQSRSIQWNDGTAAARFRVMPWNGAAHYKLAASFERHRGQWQVHFEKIAE